jgi:hypothetical protein
MTRSFPIYHLPTLFPDPVLYFQTLIALHHQQSELWALFTSTPALVDAFFDLHSGFLRPLPARSKSHSWQYRISLTETLFLLFLENAKTAPKAVLWGVKFLDLCTQLIAFAPLEISSVLLRYIIHLVRTGQPKIPKEELREAAAKLLATLDDANSPLVGICINFWLSVRPAVLSPTRVVRLISARGIKSMRDIELVSELTDGSCVLTSLIFLSRAAIQSKIWHRACMQEIRVLLAKFAARAEVHEFAEVFVRRFFVFIALATAARKFATRALLLCESLSALLGKNLLWVHPLVLPGAASILATKQHPPCFKCFFPSIAPVDETLVQEFEAFSAGAIALKTFPFDRNKFGFVVPQLDLIPRPPTGRKSGRSPLEKVARPASKVQEVMPIAGGQMAPRVHSRKRIEPVIMRPATSKQTRPLASAICTSPAYRRDDFVY